MVMIKGYILFTWQHWFMSFWLLWFMFVVLSPLRNKVKNYKWYIKWPINLVIAIFIFGDVLWNLVPATVLFLEFPSLKRLTFSQRLNYIVRNRAAHTWRFKLAWFIGDKLLNPFWPNHISIK